MKNEQLNRAVGYIDEELLAEAIGAREATRNTLTRWVLPLAFASMLLVGLVVYPRVSDVQQEIDIAPVDVQLDVFAMAESETVHDEKIVLYQATDNNGSHGQRGLHYDGSGIEADILPVFKDLYLSFDEEGNLLSSCGLVAEEREEIVRDVAHRLGWDDYEINQAETYTSALFADGRDIVCTNHSRLTIRTSDEGWTYGEQVDEQMVMKALEGFSVVQQIEDPVIVSLDYSAVLFDNSGTTARSLFNYTLSNIELDPHMHFIRYLMYKPSLECVGQYALLGKEEVLELLRNESPWLTEEPEGCELVYWMYGEYAVPSYRFWFAEEEKEYIYPALSKDVYEMKTSS